VQVTLTIYENMVNTKSVFSRVEWRFL